MVRERSFHHLDPGRDERLVGNEGVPPEPEGVQEAVRQQCPQADGRDRRGSFGGQATGLDPGREPPKLALIS